jgi:dienelactone hydrolase
VARRHAEDGFVALAVDHLSRHGGTASFASTGAAHIALSTLTHNEIVTDLHAAQAYLRSHPAVRSDPLIQRVTAGSTPSIHRYL